LHTHFPLHHFEKKFKRSRQEQAKRSVTPMCCRKRLFFGLKPNYMSIRKIPTLLLLIIGFHAQGQVQNMPDFSLKKMNGTGDYSKRDLPPGKKNFFLFFDTGCPHCQRTVTEFNKHYKELKSPTILLITMDRKEDVDAFRDKYGKELFTMKNVTLLYDGQRQFIARFLPKMFPAMYLYNPEGGLIMYSNEEKDVAQFIKQLH
jgi:peroxiredoxin